MPRREPRQKVNTVTPLKRLLTAASVLTLVLLTGTMIRGTFAPPYAPYQRAYGKRLKQGDPEADYPVRIRQLVLPDLGRVDRCVSCHVAVEDPRMADADQPLKAHPGEYLSDHDMQRIGCTSCHDGQGRAITAVDAHANEFEHWERKRLPDRFVQSTCTRCHSADSPVMMPAFVRGRDLFRGRGCRGCHQLRGKGGLLGPALDGLGEASVSVKMPIPKNRHELVGKFEGDVNLAYIYEAVLTPKAQPAETLMFDYKLSEAQAIDLVVYLKSLTVTVMSEALNYARGPLDEPDGGQLYAMYCSACHGADGMGTRMEELKKIGPAIAHPAFLAVADPGFIRAKIHQSNSSVMPSWGTAGKLTAEEIGRISDYIWSTKGTPVPLREVDREEGVPRFGAMLANGRCASCHGFEGEYSMDMIGPTLNSPELLSQANQTFLYRTITAGRAGTAMPSWHFLPARDLADLTAYFEQKREARATFEAATRARQDPQAARWGRSRYAGVCATCHGRDGEGVIGPSLNSPEFQLLASDQFLFDTITRGREGTAMGRYAHLGADDIGWLITHIRSFASAPAERRIDPDAEILGFESRGAETFARFCAQCHGAEGVGHIAPAVGNRDFLAAADDAFLKETISYGRGGSGMAGNLRGSGGTAGLSERTINDIVVYLRLLGRRAPDYAGLPRTQGDVSLGRERFARLCAQCHGVAGSGDRTLRLPGSGR